MPGSFIDTNVLVYLASGDPAKADRAEQIAAAGGKISVQVLNELANMARRKMGPSWPETHAFLASVRALLPVEPMTPDLHDLGLAIAERYGLSVYDAMIAASALHAVGYTFRSRSAVGRNQKRFVGFIPAVSDKAAKRMRLEVRRWRLHQRTDLNLDELARRTRPFLSGWVRYYGLFYPSRLRDALRTIDVFIVRWVSQKIPKVPASQVSGTELAALAQAAQPHHVRPLDPGTGG